MLFPNSEVNISWNHIFLNTPNMTSSDSNEHIMLKTFVWEMSVEVQVDQFWTYSLSFFNSFAVALRTIFKGIAEYDPLAGKWESKFNVEFTTTNMICRNSVMDAETETEGMSRETAQE